MGGKTLLKHGGHVKHHHEVERKHAHGGFAHHDTHVAKHGSHGHKMHEHHTKSHMAKHDHGTEKVKRFAAGGGIHVSPMGASKVKGLSERMSPDITERMAARRAGVATPMRVPGGRIYKKGGSVHHRADGMARKGHTKGRMV